MTDLWRGLSSPCATGAQAFASEAHTSTFGQGRGGEQPPRASHSLDSYVCHEGDFLTFVMAITGAFFSAGIFSLNSTRQLATLETILMQVRGFKRIQSSPFEVKAPFIPGRPARSESDTVRTERPTPPSTIPITSGRTGITEWATSIGHPKKKGLYRQEDRIAVSNFNLEPSLLAAVLDGAGGAQFGDRVAEMGAKLIQNPALVDGLSLPDLIATGDCSNPLSLLTEIAHRLVPAFYRGIHRPLQDYGKRLMQNPEGDAEFTPTSTLSGSFTFNLPDARYPTGRQAVFGLTEGDSRIYLQTTEGTWLISRDHSTVQGQIETGYCPKAEAWKNPRRNEIRNTVTDPFFHGDFVFLFPASPEHRTFGEAEGVEARFFIDRSNLPYYHGTKEGDREVFSTIFPDAIQICGVSMPTERDQPRQDRYLRGAISFPGKKPRLIHVSDGVNDSLSWFMGLLQIAQRNFQKDRLTFPRGRCEAWMNPVPEEDTFESQLALGRLLGTVAAGENAAEVVLQALLNNPLCPESVYNLTSYPDNASITISHLAELET